MPMPPLPPDEKDPVDPIVEEIRMKQGVSRERLDNVGLYTFLGSVGIVIIIAIIYSATR